MSPLEQYNSIIYFRQQYPPAEGERHHIIPKSCGGCNEEWNLVRLTTEEHIECHRLLTLIYPTGEEHFRMCAAYALMCTSRSKIKVSEEEAARARDNARKASSELQKGRIPWNKGKTGIYSEDTLRKIREARSRQVCSEETRRKMSESRIGKHHVTEDGKRRCREANLHRVVSEETKQKLRERQKAYWSAFSKEERKSMMETPHAARRKKS